MINLRRLFQGLAPLATFLGPSGAVQLAKGWRSHRPVNAEAIIYIFLSAAALLTAPGCAAYRFGNETLYAADVQTVYVPMIESDSFRRSLGEQLTEAVVKEIEDVSPFKVVGTPDADSILAIRLTSDTKRVVIENQNDDPRAIETAVYASVTWHNRRREPLRDPMAIALPAEMLSIGQTAAIIPEAGQSVVTQQQLAIQRLAKQIVSTMEEPW